MKSLSCGVVLTNGEVLLAIQPWGKRTKRDLPKGGINAGETPLDAALRELYEETSVQLDREGLIDLGQFKYIDTKDLHLFLKLTDDLPDPEYLKCLSTFTNSFGKVVPEAVAFEYIPFNDPRFYFGLQPILAHIKESLDAK